MKFSPDTALKIGFYVYALVDPRDNKIFYVGRGASNSRCSDHLKSSSEENQKSERIKDIREHTNSEPRIDILRHDLRDLEECKNVESAIIDTIGLENLTNKIRGEGIDKGRQSAKEIELRLGAKPMDISEISERGFLFFINKSYSPTMNKMQLYDCTRQFWSISEEGRTLESNGKLIYSTAVAISSGVVVCVYNIVKWFPAGTTLSSRNLEKKKGIIPVTGIIPKKNKWEFVGNLIRDHQLTGKRLTGINLIAPQTGWRYLNKK